MLREEAKNVLTMTGVAKRLIKPNSVFINFPKRLDFCNVFGNAKDDNDFVGPAEKSRKSEEKSWEEIINNFALLFQNLHLAILKKKASFDRSKQRIRVLL